jgi:GNAT superfamily N-acetyltransferase
VDGCNFHVKTAVVRARMSKVGERSFCIRAARPADAEFLAWVILAASRAHLPRGWFDIALGISESACLSFLGALATSTVRSLWHYSCFLVAEAESHPVGAISACRAEETMQGSAAAILATVRTTGMPHMAEQRLWQRGAYMFTCNMCVAPDCWVVENVASLPAVRRHGYMANLLEHILQEGYMRGLREAQVTSIIGNEAAERAYLKAGFRYAEERRHPHFEEATGAPGLRRFVRELRGSPTRSKADPREAVRSQQEESASCNA